MSIRFINSIKLAFHRVNIQSIREYRVRSAKTYAGYKYNKLVFGRFLDLARRRKILEKQGLFKILPRHLGNVWNLDAECFAFKHRISEPELSNEIVLKCLDEKNFDKEFSDNGRELTEDFCLKYLRYSWPKLPEDGIRNTCDYLMNEKQISYRGKGIGMDNIISTNEDPINDEVISKCFFSVINAIHEISGYERSSKFIIDFICTNQVGTYIWETWPLDNPILALANILKNSKWSEMEPRILGILGKGTLEQVIRVGIYSDKKLLGEGIEDSEEKALLMAAYDSLAGIFHQRSYHTSLNFKTLPKDIHEYNKPNVLLTNYCI